MYFQKLSPQGLFLYKFIDKVAYKISYKSYKGNIKEEKFTSIKNVGIAYQKVWMDGSCQSVDLYQYQCDGNFIDKSSQALVLPSFLYLYLYFSYTFPSNTLLVIPTSRSFHYHAVRPKLCGWWMVYLFLESNKKRG